MAKDVIIACDFASQAEVLAFLDRFGQERPFVKIGMELFYAEGPAIVKALKERGHKVCHSCRISMISRSTRTTSTRQTMTRKTPLTSRSI